MIRYYASEILPEVTGNFSSAGLHINAFNTTITSHTFEDGVGIIEFEEDVNLVGSKAFYNCNKMTKIKLPNSVISIDKDAFQVCTSLISITIPNSVTSIGSGAFYHCTSLTSITIPDSVTSIGGQAFGYCTFLTSITIPSSVTSISDKAFNECYFLLEDIINNSSLNAEENNYWGAVICSNNIDGLLIKDNEVVMYRGTRINVVVPNSITSIRRGAFANSSIVEIEIPNSVTVIEDAVFFNCTSLTSITIPDSVTRFEGIPFENCTNLSTIIFGSGFEGGINLSYFMNCPRISNITVSPNNPTYDSRDNCNAVVRTATDEIVLGSNNMTIPNGIKSLSGIDSFSELEVITIPSSVTSIAEATFFGCINLANVTCLATAPPEVEYDSLGGGGFNPSAIYVPSSSVDAYKSAPGWSQYASVIRTIE